MAGEECEPSLRSTWGPGLLLWDESPQEALDWVPHGGFGWRRPVTLSLQTLEEIAELQEGIRHLEEDLRRKLQNLKLCHTRLESRTYRPNVELCRDQVRGYPCGAWAPHSGFLRITPQHLFLAEQGC